MKIGKKGTPGEKWKRLYEKLRDRPAHLNGLYQAVPVMHQVNPTSRQEPPTFNDTSSYLDRVKTTYSDRPDVYNRFLDIMKDFKSQAIDTLGAVSRVANLFYDTPALITSFNTLLSPGWKVECGIEGDSGTVRAVSPAGTITTIPPSNYHGTIHLPQSRSYRTERVSRASLFGVSEASSVNSKRCLVEFDHAIAYVNKIKVSLTATFSSMSHSLKKDSHMYYTVWTNLSAFLGPLCHSTRNLRAVP